MVKILGYSISSGQAVDSEGETSRGVSILEFLLQSKLDTLRIMYDLNLDVLSLLDTLGVETVSRQKLRLSTKLTLSPYHLKYVEGRFLSIKRRGAFSFFANALQYLPDLEDSPGDQAIDLARKAKSIGEGAFSILKELGVTTPSLVSPSRAYEKTQVDWLKEKRLESLKEGNPVKAMIIESVGNNVFGEAWAE